MRKLIIAIIAISCMFACKKSTDTKTDVPIKYYFKIEPEEIDGTHNTSTNYKTEVVY